MSGFLNENTAYLINEYGLTFNLHLWHDAVINVSNCKLLKQTHTVPCYQMLAPDFNYRHVHVHHLTASIKDPQSKTLKILIMLHFYHAPL